MTIAKNKSLNTLVSESGPVELNVMRYARGTAVLGGAGSVVVSVPGFPANAQAFVTCALTNPNTGAISTSYNSATGDLTLTSDAGAGDANADVNWLLLD